MMRNVGIPMATRFAALVMLVVLSGCGIYSFTGIDDSGAETFAVDYLRTQTPLASETFAQRLTEGMKDLVLQRSALDVVADNADLLGVDASRIIVAGDSGGGNLTLASGMKLLREGDVGLVQGLYALCPFIAGSWPLDENPSSIENNGILLSLHKPFQSAWDSAPRPEAKDTFDDIVAADARFDLRADFNHTV